MQIVRTIAELRGALKSSRKPVLVPTMGNLHDGHLSLVRIARERNEPVIASIFVNRLQFAPHEDFAHYPRTFGRDCELLERVLAAEVTSSWISYSPFLNSIIPLPRLRRPGDSSLASCLDVGRERRSKVRAR